MKTKFASIQAFSADTSVETMFLPLCLILYIPSITFDKQRKKNNQSKYKRMYHDNSSITLTHPFVLLFLLFFLMTAMASTSMLATCMSFPVVMLMVRTLNIWIIIECFIDKRFYCFIRISGNSSVKLNTGCR